MKRPGNDCTLDTLHDYFRAKEGGGTPGRYEHHPERGKLVADWVTYACPNREGKILDIGCNVGRNSEGLRRAGYKRLNGIEINSHAVAEMGRKFPKLAALMTVHNEPLEIAAPKLVTNDYEVAFTMTVLMHIHPDSSFVFHHIARCCLRLITIENELADNRARWKRDYGKVLTALGAEQITVVRSDLAGNEGNYFVRVFDCEGVQ